MSNERLRAALANIGLAPNDLAEELQVDPKTVERWLNDGRTPYARYRNRVAARVGESEVWLWPKAITRQRADEASRSELVELFPRRASVPAQLWSKLFSSSSTFIDVLVYAGLFLPEQYPTVIEDLRQRAAAGTRIRLLLGDPQCAAVDLRGVEESIGGDAVPTKVRNALALLRPVVEGTPIAIRLHGSTLYTSVYRGDDQMIANPHVLGLPAAQAPALHLRRVSAGGLFDTYAAMYDRVWDQARPAWM